MIDSYIALGSNLGDRLDNLARGVGALAALPATELVAVSHVYETEPWGVEGQQTFYNAVASILTRLQADQLLELLKDAEAQLGRKPTSRFGPRLIDLDILLYDDEEWRSETLTIPHPRMAEREFVIRPLLEIAPNARYPDGSYVTDERARQGRVVAELGPIPGWEDKTPEPSEPRSQAGTSRRARADLTPEDFRAIRPTADYRVAGAPEGFRTASGEEWEPVGVARLDPSPDMPELLFYETVLKGAGVPCEFYPERPGEGFYNPYGIPRFVDLYVPRSRLREARELIRQAREAPPAGE